MQAGENEFEDWDLGEVIKRLRIHGSSTPIPEAVGPSRAFAKKLITII